MEGMEDKKGLMGGRGGRRKREVMPIPPMAPMPEAEEIVAEEVLARYLSGEIDLICVLGPTASGKTRYAVELARAINSLMARRSPGEGSDGGVRGEGAAGWAVEERGGRWSEGSDGGTRGERAARGADEERGGRWSEGSAGEVRGGGDGERGEKGSWGEGLDGGDFEEGRLRMSGGVDGGECGEGRGRGCEGSGGCEEGGCEGESCGERGSWVEIVSADSRQVYKGMDIGTGKDLEEYGEIPYHLIDIAPAGTKYNIYRYQQDFEKAYADIIRRGKIPILCGGSGLYIEAVTCGYSLPDVPANPELRTRLEAQDTDQLIAMLAGMKQLHNTTDYDTRQRLIRAIEIAVYEKEHPVSRTAFLPRRPYYIGTLVSRDERNARIDRRLDARLQEGMVEEIRGLLEGGIAADDLIYYGLEYKFVTLYLTGQMDYDTMRERLAIAIHQFAKRQMTWFRGMEKRRGIHIHWTRTR